MGKFSKVLEKAGLEGHEKLNRERPQKVVPPTKPDRTERDSRGYLENATPLTSSPRSTEIQPWYEGDDEILTLSEGEEIVRQGSSSKREDGLENRQPPPQPQRRGVLRTAEDDPEVLSAKWDSRFFNAVYDNQVLPEIFKTLRSRILLATENKASAGTILVTSAMPGEGKSFVTGNLALAFASGVDQYAMLVDGDLRKPTVNRLFGCSEKKGLVDYLRDRVPLSELITRSGVHKFSLLLAGRTPSNPAELLSSERMRHLIEELSSRYSDRTILFDSPPIMVAAETRVLANHVDGVILVVRQGIAGKARIEETIKAVGKERIIGIVFNDHTGNYFNKSSRYGYGYGYSYGYGYKEQKG